VTATDDPNDDRDLGVGDAAPDFHLTANDGREVSLADYRGRSHVVLFFVRAYT
jgi:peroxiredoxin Q/BCP